MKSPFQKYQETALAAGTSGDWNPWADLFTQDATYVEHLFGEFGGRFAPDNLSITLTLDGVVVATARTTLPLKN